MLEIKGFKEVIKVCKVCGDVIRQDERHIHIEKYGYVCSECYESGRHSYSEQNDKFVFQPRKDGRTVSFEFETGDTAPELAVLYKHGFIPCPDGSIDGLEWKSPIYRNLIGLSHMAKRLNPFAGYVDDECGTHIHVGTIDRESKRMFKQYQRVFLSDTFDILNNRDTEALFGRNVNEYCRADVHEGRYKAIAPDTDKPTVEFRLPKFIDNEQFMLCVKYGVDFVNILTKDVKKNFEDYDWGGKAGRFKAGKLGERLANLTNTYMDLAAL